MSSDTRVGGPAERGSTVFAQNGQVDWVAFGESIWSASSVTLQRFASAGVQPITFGAGLAIASAFTLDRVGKERMHSAMENLRGFWSFEKLLYFGFGARSFLHVMADAQSGVNCIALCSALSEVHNEHAAAWILDELWKLYGYPPQFLPSHSQLTALVKACSGVLSRTEFSHISGTMLGHTLKIRPMDMSNIEDIAKALRGLFRVSQGELARITVMGGMNCAFIAGFAYWILNLKVYVEDEAGRLIYQDSDLEEAQVVVTYCQQASLSLIQISSTTYILRNDDGMFMRNRTLQEANLTFRTPWDGCLTRVFGTNFTALTKAPKILGGFLGSVARVYQALALGESDVGQFSRATFINFVEPSYGIGFVNSVVSIFPELNRMSGLLDEMQTALNVPLREAVRIIERTVLDLEQLCQCDTCTHGSTLRICKVALAFSIRDMVSTLSCVKRDDNLLPAIRGIDLVHVRQSTNWQFQSKASGRPLLDTALDLGMEGVGGDDADRIKKFDRLSHPMELFSGYSDHDRYLAVGQFDGHPQYCTAAVNHGLCYFLDCLRSISSHAENARMVHIVPGPIQMGDKQFNNVYDIPGGSEEPSTKPAPVQADILEGFQPTSIIRQARGFDLKIDMLATESAAEQELMVYYRATIPGGPVIRLRPGWISKAVLKGTGILTCKHMHCTERLVIPCALVRQGWLVSNECDVRTWVDASTGPKCLIWPQLDDFARCVAIQLHCSGQIVIRKNECISCCTVSLVHEMPRVGNKDLYHLM
ncbi:MAG: hypothetical protein L6R42_000426 [Xanthoria sp. 1 TBL-2021]|nr:MAG: hypothetical protein L6R42_000426 [Xanthoria sp. 1 TBL-2021]